MCHQLNAGDFLYSSWACFRAVSGGGSHCALCCISNMFPSDLFLCFLSHVQCRKPRPRGAIGHVSTFTYFIPALKQQFVLSKTTPTEISHLMIAGCSAPNAMSNKSPHRHARDIVSVQRGTRAGRLERTTRRKRFVLGELVVRPARTAKSGKLKIKSAFCRSLPPSETSIDPLASAGLGSVIRPPLLLFASSFCCGAPCPD